MNKNIIFMINIVHNERSKNQGYEWSIKSWQKYAEKYGHELFILDQFMFDINYLKPQWYKIYILDLLESNKIDYDQVLYVDSDTVVHDNAPDIFAITDHKFCAVRNYGDMDWVCRSIENYSKHVFNGFTFPFYKYFNSGVMVFNKKHKPLFKSLQDFYENNRELIIQMQTIYGVGNDQPVLNFFVNKEIPDDYKNLGYEWNMQDMTRLEVITEDFLHTKYGYISHYNAGVKPTPGYWIEKTYKHIYNDNIA
jgi:lipopolysaccharide biosynthesis glycosyltransferase